MATITVDYTASPRIITIAAPDVSIRVQELINLIRPIEDDLINHDDLHLVNAVGKNPLPGGLFTVITMDLLNARIKFADRAGPSIIECVITEGNVIAQDLTGSSISPIEPSTFTYVVIAQATTGGLVSGEFLADIQKIRGSAQAAINLGKSAESMQIGTVSTMFAPATATVFTTGDIITFPKDEHWKSRALIFLTGGLAKQAARLQDSEFTSHGTKLTVSGFTDPPVDGDMFIIV